MKEEPEGSLKKRETITDQQLFNFAWWLKKQGLREATIQIYTGYLTRLKRKGANLYDPETVKEALAKSNWSENTKSIAIKAYNKFLKYQGGTWDPPSVKPYRKLPFIPLEKELDQLIGAANKKLAAFLQLLKETGMRSGEAWRLKWTDVDFERQTVTLNLPEKNSKPRIFKVSSNLLAMLNLLPKENEKIFTGSLTVFRRTYRKFRKRLAYKLQNPRLNKISFHVFRHWKATMEYNRTKDILYVKELLGHRDIKTTLIYTQLVNFKSNEYICRKAVTVEEAKKLVEEGFEYVCETEGVQLFRKRK
ncbi:site-specific integrase [Candidatus Bathyarchaeota archaeon]|nr:MAG: site-specific integrase [Candidatus Bathyarchaeota archaeon]